LTFFHYPLSIIQIVFLSGKSVWVHGQRESLHRNLTGRVGTGNRIGKGTILQLNRELETAKKDGLFSGGRK
jgi:hypothetical protein